MTLHSHVRSPLGAAGLALLLVLGTASTSRAQDAQAENIAAARSLGIQGVQLADAGKCPEAIEKLERAESLYHAPTILGRLGECRVNVGQIVQGTEDLNRVVREQLPANAPKAFHDAQDRAQKVLQTAQPKIARLTVKIDPPDAKPNVTVDNKPIPAALIGVERPTDPGSHQVVAAAPGYLNAQTTVTLADGGHQEITLKLEKDPNAAALAPVPGAMPGQPGVQPTPVPGAMPVQPGAPAQPGVAAQAPKSGKGLAIGALVVGGIGVGVGSITGLMAMSKVSDCSNKTCSSQSKIDDAKSMATISTVGFGVGVAGLVLGTILLVSGNHSEAPAGAPVAKHESPKLSMQPWIGVNAAGVTGAF